MIKRALLMVHLARILPAVAAFALYPSPASGCGNGVGGLGGDGGPVWGVADPIVGGEAHPCANPPAPPAPSYGDCGPAGGSWGVADPIVAAVRQGNCHSGDGAPPSSGGAGHAGQAYGSSSNGPNSAAAGTTTFQRPTDPSAAGQAAEIASRMNGHDHESQLDMQTTTQRLNSYSSEDSRSLGTLDTLEGILLFPIDALTGGHLLWSGEQAHRAANTFEANSRISSSNGERLGAVQNATGASAAKASSSSASQASASSGAGGSRIFESERAQGLFGLLESNYGVNRDEFVAAVGQVRGNPGAVGDFMQEKSGNPKLGRDAVTAAVDVYLASRGEDAHLMATAPQEGAQRVPASLDARAQPVISDAPQLARGVAAKVASEESLRDRLRKALLDRASAGPAPGSLADSSESLEPLREGLFRAANEEEQGQSLFDVVHTKYSSLTERMRPKTVPFRR